MKHEFVCEHCGEVLNHSILNPTSIVKCPKCGKEYIVTKHLLATTLEVIFLFAMAVGARFVLNALGLDLNVLFQLLIVIGILIFINMIFDIIFIRYIKWQDYIYLVERKDPSEYLKRKKNQE